MSEGTQQIIPNSNNIIESINSTVKSLSSLNKTIINARFDVNNLSGIIEYIGNSKNVKDSDVSLSSLIERLSNLSTSIDEKGNLKGAFILDSKGKSSAIFSSLKSIITAMNSIDDVSIDNSNLKNITKIIIEDIKPLISTLNGLEIGEKLDLRDYPIKEITNDGKYKVKTVNAHSIFNAKMIALKNAIVTMSNIALIEIPNSNVMLGKLNDFNNFALNLKPLISTLDGLDLGDIFDGKKTTEIYEPINKVCGIFEEFIKISTETEKLKPIDNKQVHGIINSIRMILEHMCSEKTGLKIEVDENIKSKIDSVTGAISSLSKITDDVNKFDKTKVPDENKLRIAIKSVLGVTSIINDEISKQDLNKDSVKEVAEKIKPITEIIDRMIKISTAMNSLAAVGMVGIVKYKFAIVNLLQTINLIQTSLSNFEFSKETMNQMTYMEKTINSMSVIANKLMIVGLISFVLNKLGGVLKEFISLCVTLCVELSKINIPEEAVSQIEDAEKAFSALYEISKQLIIIALLSPFIWMFKKPILSSIDLIVDICAKLADLKDVSENAKNAAIVGKSLAEFAKGILVFVLASMGGIVFLVGIIALYMFKLFMNVFITLFDKDTIEKIKTSQDVMNDLSKTLLILSGVIVLWMLVGVLLVEAWKYVLITAAFVFVSMAILIGLGWMQQFIKKGEESLMMLAKVIVVISMTVVLWSLTGLLIQEEWHYLITVVVCVAIAIGFMMWLNKSFKEVTSGTKTILVLSLTLMLISMTVLLWAITGELVFERWEEIAVVGTFVAVIIALMLLLSKAKNTIIKGGMSILLLSASVLVLSLAIGLMAVIGEKVIENIGGILLTLGIIVAIVGVYAVIGIPAVAAFVGLGAVVMAVVAASILVFSVGLLILVGVSKIVDWEDIGKMAAIITSICFAVALLGPLSPFIILGSAAMLTLGAALLVFMIPLLMFAGIIKIFKSIDATEEDIERPIALIGYLITSIFKNIGIKALLIPAASAIMLSLLPLVLSVGAMAQVIESLANLRIATKFDKNGKPIDFREMTEDDFTNAGKNIGTIMTSIVTALSDPQLSSNLLLLESKAIENIGGVLSSMSGLKNIVDVVQQMAHMSVATAWNSEGKPIKFTQITEQQRADAITNAITLMTEFLAGISSETVINNLEDMNRRSRKALESVMSSCSGLKNLVDVIKEVSNYDNAKIITEVGKVGTFVTEYISVYSKITGENGIKSNKVSEERFEMFKDFVEETKKFTSIKSDALKANVDSFTTFVDKANSIDTNKIKTVKDMFAEMTELSKSMKGDFDKLADVLSDKLVVVLEKLQETISGIPTNVSVSQNTVSQNKSANTVVNNTQPKQQTQVNTIQPQNNDKINKNLVDIKDSIDDMIALLTSVKNNTENYRGY